MREILKKIKNFLKGNILKNLKLMIERTGIWLIALLNITIPVACWLISNNVEVEILRTAAQAAYVVTIEYLCFDIGKIFKNGTSSLMANQEQIKQNQEEIIELQESLAPQNGQ